MNLIHISPKDLPKNLADHHIGIVVSDFNELITSKLEAACVETLLTHMNEDQLQIIHVPGAVEIPLLLQKLAQRKKFSALIALGAVIRGETSHYDYVCSQVSDACQKVMLDHNLPVIFGVLTTENEEQAFDRAGGSHGNKGADAALCALQMIETLARL